MCSIPPSLDPSTIHSSIHPTEGSGKTLLLRQILHLVQPKAHPKPTSSSSILQTIGIDVRHVSGRVTTTSRTIPINNNKTNARSSTSTNTSDSASYRSNRSLDDDSKEGRQLSVTRLPPQPPPPPQPQQRVVQLSLREVGGCMRALWPRFVTDTRFVVYVIDGSANDPSWEAAGEG